MSQTIISARNLSKRYIIGHQRNGGDGLRHRLENAVRHPFKWFVDRKRQLQATREEFWALKDVSFEIKQGEVVGIIGRNGAGKSTLLKVLSRITEPTSGRVEIDGRVASLLEVGTGFHQELTGRENIFLNGAILGMTKAEIKRKFDEIVAFSEVERFLDTPVKHYSSGMYVRLAFAVAAHLEPEILIVDEVLAVGDVEFQRKCLGRMSHVAHSGRTVLFVSHNMAAVQSLCRSAILLENGRVRAIGSPAELIPSYASNLSAKSFPVADRTDREGNGQVRIENFRILDSEGSELHRVMPGQPIIFEISYRASATDLRVMASIDIETMEGVRITTLWSGLYNSQFRTQREGKLYCRLDEVALRPSDYSLNIGLMNQFECFDFLRGATVLHVEPSDFYQTGRVPSADHGPLMSKFCWSDKPIQEGAGTVTPLLVDSHN
jgi:lipopolysaccharide transport system ATP-binding protein